MQHDTLPNAVLVPMFLIILNMDEYLYFAGGKYIHNNDMYTAGGRTLCFGVVSRTVQNVTGCRNVHHRGSMHLARLRRSETMSPSLCNVLDASRPPYDDAPECAGASVLTPRGAEEIT